MAASYSFDPSASPTDLMRCLVGDTGPSFLLQDEEVVALYDPARGTYTCAADISDALAARCNQQVDVSAEGVTTRASQRAEAFRKQAERYRALAIRLGEPGASASATSGTSGGAPVLVGCDRDDDWRWCDRRDPYSWPLPGWR